MRVAGDAREVVAVGRDTLEIERRRVCCTDVEAVWISPRAMRELRAVLLYVFGVVELMRSRHRDAEAAVRFIVVLIASFLRLLSVPCYLSPIYLI